MKIFYVNVFKTYEMLKHKLHIKLIINGSLLLLIEKCDFFLMLFKKIKTKRCNFKNNYTKFNAK